MMSSIHTSVISRIFTKFYTWFIVFFPVPMMHLSEMIAICWVHITIGMELIETKIKMKQYLKC